MGHQANPKRTVDFGATDKPLTPQELAKDNLIQFPAVVGTINVVFNIPGVLPMAPSNFQMTLYFALYAFGYVVAKIPTGYR